MTPVGACSTAAERAGARCVAPGRRSRTGRRSAAARASERGVTVLEVLFALAMSVTAGRARDGAHERRD